VSPFHQRTIAALSQWLGAGTGSEILKTRGNHEARIADASDALEALREELRESTSGSETLEEELTKTEDRVNELVSDLEDAHLLLADLREHIELLDGGPGCTPDLLRRIEILTGEVAAC
jgi:chromosome segregation ATPase